MVTVVAIWAALAGLVLWINMAVWIAVVLGLTTLPAVWEIWCNPVSTLVLDDRGLRWQTQRQQGDVPLGIILKVRMDTRLDLSVRATLMMKDGRKLRLPPPCTPPHQEFEAALKGRGLHVERHHFAFFG